MILQPDLRANGGLGQLSLGLRRGQRRVEEEFEEGVGEWSRKGNAGTGGHGWISWKGDWVKGRARPGLGRGRLCNDPLYR